MTILTLLNFITVLTIFTDFLIIPSGGFKFFEFRGPFLLLTFVLIMIYLFTQKAPYHKGFFLTFAVIIIFSIYNIFLGRDTWLLLFKQVFGIGLSMLGYYAIFKANKFELNNLFNLYLKFAFILGLIGVIQEISFLVGFEPGYNFSYLFPSFIQWTIVPAYQFHFLRVNSLTLEPTGFCYVMMPAFFSSLISLLIPKVRIYKKWQSIIIILSILFTLSSTGYLGIGAAILFYIINKKKNIKTFFSALPIIILLVFAFTSIPDLNKRATDLIGGVTGTQSLGGTNQSSFVLIFNTSVALDSLRQNPIFGSGLGSHELSHSRYAEAINFKNTYGPTSIVVTDFLSTNSKDASSMFIRLASETGLFGLFVVFLFIYKNYLSAKDDKANYLWIINNGVLLVLLLRLFRGGHYFDEGLFFFFWMYYYSKQNAEKLRASI